MIKLFEEYNEKTYTEYSDAFTYVNDLNGKKFVNLYHIIPLLKKSFPSLRFSKNPDIIGIPTIDVYKIYDGDRESLIFDIIEAEDEWFYIAYTGYYGDSKCYKCDQLEGLIDCIKNTQS